MRTLGIDDFLTINRMTIPEFELRMKAAELKQLDRIHELHILAWAINQARATKRNGRPVFRTFRSFFDFEKQEKKILEWEEVGTVKPIHPEEKGVHEQEGGGKTWRAIA